MAKRDEIYIKELSKVLVEFDKSEYSLNGEKDSAICLDCINNEWVVYECEHVAKRDLKTYNNIVEASLEMIRRLANEDDINRLTNSFLDAIMQINS